MLQRVDAVVKKPKVFLLSSILVLISIIISVSYQPTNFTFAYISCNSPVCVNEFIYGDDDISEPSEFSEPSKISEPSEFSEISEKSFENNDKSSAENSENVKNPPTGDENNVNLIVMFALFSAVIIIIVLGKKFGR